VSVEGDERIGLRIARYRDLAGLTQQQLGDGVGKTQSYIAMIESGKRRVATRELLIALAETLRVPISDLTRQPDQAIANGRDRVIHTAVPEIRAALDGAEGPSGRSLEMISRDTETAMIARMACDYPALATILPDLIRDTRWHAERDRRPHLVGLNVRVCVTAAIALRPLGYLDLAVRFAERAQQAASQVADPVLMAAADYTAAQACLAGGMRSQQSRSWGIAREAASRITSLNSDDARVWYGMTHLQAALSAAALGRAGDIETHLAEADDVAATVPADRWVQDFSPANVSIWRLAIALERKDADIAVAAVRSADLAGLRTRQRRARFYGDAGRAYFLAGSPDDAVVAFLTALEISPTDVRSRVVIRDITSQMVLSGHRSPHLHALTAQLRIDPLGLAHA
jgi:transcriptional regulator with XRE-family HTH domain